MKKTILIAFMILFLSTFLFSQTSNAGDDQIVCENHTFLNANNPSPYSGVWTVDVGEGTFANPNLYNTEVTAIGENINKYIWTVNGTEKDTVNITYVKSNAGEDQSVTTDHATLNATDVFGYIGHWTVIAGNGFFDGGENPTTEVTEIDYEYNIYQWAIITPNCESVDNVIITRIPYAGADIYTSETSVVLSAEIPPTGAVGVWTVMYGTGVFDDPTNKDATISELVDGTTIVRWTVTFDDDVILYDELIIEKTSDINSFSNKIKTYPNPSLDNFTIEFKEKPQNANVKIYSIDGRLVKFQELKNTTNRINVENLSSGIYFLKLQSNNKQYSTKIKIK